MKTFPACLNNGTTQSNFRLGKAAIQSRGKHRPFHFLMMEPEAIAGDDVDTAGLHLQDRFLPPGPGIPGEVDLPHDRKDRSPVIPKELAVQPQVPSFGIGMLPC